jgi:hypothetical protein
MACFKPTDLSEPQTLIPSCSSACFHATDRLLALLKSRYTCAIGGANSNALSNPSACSDDCTNLDIDFYTCAHRYARIDRDPHADTTLHP